MISKRQVLERCVVIWDTQVRRILCRGGLVFAAAFTLTLSQGCSDKPAPPAVAPAPKSAPPTARAVAKAAPVGLPTPTPVAGDPASFVGGWTILFPRGATRRVALQAADAGRLTLNYTGVLNGVYELRDDTLTVVSPRDTRMAGLVWKWDGKQLSLVHEPADHAAGQSYVGTTLTPQ